MIDFKDLVDPSLTGVNEADTRAIIRHGVAGGAGANIVFKLGTNGEFYVLDSHIKESTIDVAVDEARVIREEARVSGNPIPLDVVAGVSEPTLEGTVELAQYAEQAGVDGIVLLPLLFNRGSDGQITRRGASKVVETVLRKTDHVKVILYNLAARTDGKNLKTVTVKQLAGHPRVVATKDSSGDIKRFGDYVDASAGRAKVYIGDEILGLRYPSEGVVAGSANIFPVAYRIATSGDYSGEKRARLAEKLHEFQRIYAENSIGAFKYILHKKGVISSPAVFDKSLEVTPDFARRLDALMDRDDFEEVYGLNTMALQRT